MKDNVINQKLREKDEDGLKMLMDSYCNYVMAIISNIAKGALSTQDVEELSADVFLSVWNSSDTLQEERSIKPYLAQITRNAVISRLRRNKSTAVPFDDDIVVVSKAGNPDELAVKREQSEIINAAVEQFGEPDREIFVRFYFFGEPVKAIGWRLSLNPATVKTKLHRCRKRLKSIFEERGYRYEEGN